MVQRVKRAELAVWTWCDRRKPALTPFRHPEQEGRPSGRPFRFPYGTADVFSAASDFRNDAAAIRPRGTPDSADQPI